jgi:hypothetical protein
MKKALFFGILSVLGISYSVYSLTAIKPASTKSEIATTQEEIAQCQEAADLMAKVFNDDPNLKKGASIENTFCEKQMKPLFK